MAGELQALQAAVADLGAAKDSILAAINVLQGEIGQQIDPAAVAEATDAIGAVSVALNAAAVAINPPTGG